MSTEKLARHLVMADRVASRFRVAYQGVGTTEEVGAVRIHRYRTAIKVWDLTNAGKRGKKVDTLSITSPSLKEEAILEDVAWAIHGKKDFASILNQVKEEFDDQVVTHVQQERGVDVMPAGFSPVEVNGEHIYVKVELKEFTVRDNDDQNNLPTCIPAMSGGLKEIPAFYRWVKDNQAKVKSMTFKEMKKVMDDLGVKSHYFCAMD